MKDYTVSHPCGIEDLYPRLSTAKKAAIKHWDACTYRDKTIKDNDWVAIDEYDHEGGDTGNGELTGRYWCVGRDAMNQPFCIQK